MKKAFIELLYTLFFVPLFVVLSILGVIYDLATSRKEFFVRLARIFENILWSFDGLANALAGKLLNKLLIKKRAHTHGKWNELICFLIKVKELQEKLIVFLE